MGVPVLGHQGGWDEILLVALPIVLFVVLLRVANSRAAHLDEAEQAESTPSDPSGAAEEDPADHSPEGHG